MTTDTSAIALTLEAPASVVKVGAPVNFRVNVKNVSNRPVWFVGVVDGSETGIRYPHYRPRVLRGDMPVAAPPAPEDPLVSPLRPADFVLLEPGQSFDPTASTHGAAFMLLSTFSNFRPDVAGDYRFELTLSTDSPSDEAWLGRFNQSAERERVLQRVAEIPRLTVSAQPLHIRAV